MNTETVRAVLAYVMTAAVIAALGLVTFATLSQAQATLVGTVLGAILAKWNVPLAYFFDGIADESSGPPTA